jgi:hypothetical protein
MSHSKLLSQSVSIFQIKYFKIYFMDNEIEKYKKLKYDILNKLKLQHILIRIQHILIEITIHNVLYTVYNETT